MKARLGPLGFILIFGFLVCLGTFAWAEDAGITPEEAQQRYEWQQTKTPYTVEQIQAHVGTICKPIEPPDTVDPNFCYILQRQCWFDPSGYGPYRVKKCKYEEKITESGGNYYITGTYFYFCNDTDASFNSSYIQLGASWKDRILRDPACAHK